MDSRRVSVTPGLTSSRVLCDCAFGEMPPTTNKSDVNFPHIPFSCFLTEYLSRETRSSYCSGRFRRCLVENCRRLSLVFWKVFLAKRMFILLILLNPLLTESSPAQSHLRHTLRNERLCDKPQIMDHPHDQECRRFRVRRDIHHMNLREGENSTMCDYRVCVDKNANRMPQEIHRVFCVESGCRCQKEGSFRCTQLTDKVEVWYGVSQGQPSMERVDVEVGCVCAAKHAQLLDNFNPSISVDK